MQILNGEIVAEKLKQSLFPRIEKIKYKLERSPHLVVVIVGEDPASQIYVRNKDLACRKIGIQSSIQKWPHNVTQEQLISSIEALNADTSVDAVLVQFPLPSHLNKSEVLKKLSSEKDADGLTYTSLGCFFSGNDIETIKPCTPHGVMKILNHYQIPVAGQRAVVVGRSHIVGKPMAIMLADADATVTLCHSKTQNLSDHMKSASIVVVAAGKARMFGKNDFGKDAVVIDVGIHRDSQGHLCGDVRIEELEGWARAITPVPKGVGPMTIACLLENTILLTEKKISKRC